MNNTEKTQKAKEFAHINHKKHFRVSGESYFNHAKRVVNNLKQIKVNDESILAAAYLHHIPDVHNDWEQILTSEFGNDICELVREYKNLSKSEISEIYTKEINIKLIQAFFNLIKDPRILLIRLADKVDNIKTSFALSKDKSEKIAERALYLYAPVCKLLGLHEYVRILENEALKTLNPREYYLIAKFLDERLPEIKASLGEISVFIKDILKDQKIRVDIDYRIKHIYSIYRKSKKMEAKGKKGDLDKIYDIAAMRIIVDTVEQCYEVEDILEQMWENIPEERDDYIQKPKPSGYRSIHNTFKISKGLNLEIQIKTRKMHEENEFGSASHVLYKIGQTMGKNLSENPGLLKQLNYVENKQSIKLDQFNDFVYTFTPKGDIIELPRGSILLDFAYAIHKDIGNKCIGGTVNGDFCSMEHILQDGDKVDIRILNTKKCPGIDWIKKVKTKKAKEYIRKAQGKA